MRADLDNQGGVGSQLLPARAYARTLVMALVFIAALGARFYRIDASGNVFHLTRQFRSALIARAYYYRSLDSIPEWEKRVAESNLETEPRLDLPIMEGIVVVFYHLLGQENLWIPRALSSVFWVIGGLFLYATARRLASPDAALLATAFYLFVPFSVTASRSFQRDPLMVMLMLGAVFAIVRYAESPSIGALIIAGVVSALALLVKPIAFFPIFGAFLALVVLQRGAVRAVLNLHSLLFAVIALLPAVAYTAYGVFIAGSLTAQAQRSFLPHVMVYPFFWHGWLTMIGQSVGRSAFVVGLLGVLLVRDSFRRALMIGLWAGYFVFGFVFNYGIYTHNYYQLMLIPIVALSLMPAGEIILGWLHRRARPAVVRPIAWLTLFLVVFLPLEPQLWHRADPVYRKGIELRTEIGALANHSTKTIILDGAYGKQLKYYGKMCGRAWPVRSELRLQTLLGRPERTAEDRLDEMIRKYAPELFVVVAMKEYEAQPDLRRVLTSRYRVLHETPRYIIFDLTKRIDLEEPASGAQEP